MNKKWDGIYLGKGEIRTFGPCIEGQQLKIFIPEELKSDYKFYEKHLKIAGPELGANN